MPLKMPPLPTTGPGGQEPLSAGHQVLQVARNGERTLVPEVRHPRRHERPTETSHVDVQTSTSSGGTSSSRTLNNCTAQGRATDDSSSSFHDRLSPETRLRNELNCDKITPGNLATAKTTRNGGGGGVKQGSASLQNLVNGALPYCSESEGEKRSPRCRTTRSAGCSSSLPTESVFLPPPPPPLTAAGGQIEAGRTTHRSSHHGGIAASDYSAVSQATIFASSSVYRVANDNHAPSSTTSTIATNTSGYGNNLGITVTTHTSSTRTPSLGAAAGPSTSSWNNSNQETESDYVVDPVKGNTYYKGQFLGKGGFARVYLMTDVTSGSQYACKIIPKNRMQKIHMQKIAREIMIHKELNHVNVVQMHHYFEDNLNAYMLLEACPRKSLMHVLKYRGKVTEPEARYYMKQMVTGVAYIHSQKVVHRDLKPGNMFLSEHMIVKIGDFGLATRPDGQRRRVTICGTPNYIAPEVLYKQAYSYEADVWALGCILYALLVGQPPFETATLKETYARICSNQYKEVDDTIATRSGQDLIRWLLQPTPALRPSLEKVKEHAYLTKEFVPASLPHTSCYQMPPPRIIEPPIGASEHQLTHSTSSAATLPAKCKEAKVHWLVRRLPKLPRFRQRLSSVLCPSQKKSTGVITQSMQMHKALDACMSEMKTSRASRNPATVDDVTPLFVTKWIDYSNKYGLSFQLSDRSVGVLFNDSTKMSYTHDRRRVEYMTTDDEIMRYNREKDVPAPLQRKLTLMIRFIEYMDDHLTEGGEVKESSDPKQSRACVPRMKRWLRTNKAIVMELTIPLLQVNFFVDHTKMVVSQETPGRGYLITYIDAARHASSYWLNDLRDFGCTAELYERLHYVCKVAHEFAELDRNMIV